MAAGEPIEVRSGATPSIMDSVVVLRPAAESRLTPGKGAEVRRVEESIIRIKGALDEQGLVEGHERMRGWCGV